LNKYLHSETSETEVSIHTSVNKKAVKISKKKNTATSGKLILAVCASVTKFGFIVVCPTAQDEPFMPRNAVPL